ncbi:MAG: hypothetical protein CL398_04080, partial [Acidiferrobacteraceae bacterium]|nr:hypothetical protein [Acidiferrobacteraceae bacterium]
QGVSSDQVLQIPMTGRPSNWSSGRPWFFIQLRWLKPSLSAFPNHAELRRVVFFVTRLFSTIFRPRLLAEVLSAE